MVLEEWMDRINLNWLDDLSLNDHLDTFTFGINNKNQTTLHIQRCLVYLKKRLSKSKNRF